MGIISSPHTEDVGITLMAPRISASMIREKLSMALQEVYNSHVGGDGNRYIVSTLAFSRKIVISLIVSRLGACLVKACLTKYHWFVGDVTYTILVQCSVEALLTALRHTFLTRLAVFLLYFPACRSHNTILLTHLRVDRSLFNQFSELFRVYHFWYLALHRPKCEMEEVVKLFFYLC